MNYALETVVKTTIHGQETAHVVRDGITYWSNEEPKWFTDKDAEYYTTSNSISWSTEDQLSKAKEILFLAEYPLIKSLYIREQHYGGAEEGGWYYHTMQLLTDTSAVDEEDLGIDRYGEGIDDRLEVYKGEHESLSPQYYS